MEKITWHTEKRSIKSLVPLDKNPRKMSKEKAENLMNSLKKFDYVEPIVINLNSMIIAGHMRIAAMKKLKWQEKIDVRVPNRMLSEEEAREYCIRSNKNTGDWDWDILAAEWDAQDLMEWGFSSDELAEGILDIRDEDSEEEECEKEKCPNCGQKIKKKK